MAKEKTPYQIALGNLKADHPQLTHKEAVAILKKEKEAKLVVGEVHEEFQTPKVEAVKVETPKVEAKKEITIEDLRKAVIDTADKFIAYAKVSKYPPRYIAQARKLQALITRKVN